MERARDRLGQSETIEAEDTFTDPLLVNQGESVSVSIAGTAFAGTVTLQRQLDGTNWRDVPPPFTGDDEVTYTADERCKLRIGVKAGDFSGTSVAVRIGKGG